MFFKSSLLALLAVQVFGVAAQVRRSTPAKLSALRI